MFSIRIYTPKKSKSPEDFVTLSLSKASLRHTDSFGKNEINELITGTLYGTAKLLAETGEDYARVVERVATKGGITQEGVAVFNELLPEVFDKLFEKTSGKIIML